MYGLVMWNMMSQGFSGSNSLFGTASHHYIIPHTKMLCCHPLCSIHLQPGLAFQLYTPALSDGVVPAMLCLLVLKLIGNTCPLNQVVGSANQQTFTSLQLQEPEFLNKFHQLQFVPSWDSCSLAWFRSGRKNQ